MDTDTAIVPGIVIGAFSIISIYSALLDRWPPRALALTVLMATGLIVYATTTSEVGYTAAFLPRTFVNVFVKYLPQGAAATHLLLPSAAQPPIAQLLIRPTGSSGMPSRAQTDPRSGDGNAQDEDEIERQEALQGDGHR
ncbi:hypothetical protein [uncultured Roseobacter sp.]|uniref:hypothetical protein n=1 Tax=uncultured Roseobacter sp. TaxID=114847 RepID=UPI00261C95FB|nr:hypothetical protein [uncultured Roseobacter sp.]